MAPKTAPWGRWPSQWLKRLPAPVEETAAEPFSPAQTGTPGATLKQSPHPETVVFRFEDFVDRPLKPDSESLGTDRTDDGKR